MLVLIIGIVVLVLLVAFFGRSKHDKNIDNNTAILIDEDCCGAHEICELDLRKMSEEVIYYDDEELDLYKNYKEKEYTNRQIDEFREILYSLKKNDIRGWVHSLNIRNITIPSIIKSELVSILADD